jgi:hypothetical protein
MRNGYAWSYHPDVRHLFSTPLSSQTVLVYEELCAGVGVHFRATATGRRKVAGPRLQSIRPQQPHHGEPPEASPGDTTMPCGGDGNNASSQNMARVQALLDAEGARARHLQKELEITQANSMRLIQEWDAMAGQFIARETLLNRSLHALDLISQSVAELRGEICEATSQSAFAPC